LKFNKNLPPHNCPKKKKVKRTKEILCLQNVVQSKCWCDDASPSTPPTWTPTHAYHIQHKMLIKSPSPSINNEKLDKKCQVRPFESHHMGQ